MGILSAGSSSPVSDRMKRDLKDQLELAGLKGERRASQEEGVACAEFRV